MGLVIEPFALIAVSIGVDQPSPTVSHVIAPVAFVLGAIVPDLNSTSLAQALLRPAALVDSAVIQFVGAATDQVRSILEFVFVPLEGPDLLFSCPRRLI